MRVSAIVVAAGKGQRMNADQNKVFMPLAGHAVLTYCLRIFDKLDKINEIICVHAAGEAAAIEQCIAEANIQTPVLTVQGGQLRQQSVLNGLALVNSNNDYVVIHDGARPLLTLPLVQNLLAEVQKAGAVIPVIPVKDTIKRINNNTVIETLPRQELFAVQTPQAFHKELLSGLDGDIGLITDEASFVERCHSVAVVAGDVRNIKITTPEDLWLAEAIVRKVEDYQW